MSIRNFIIIMAIPCIFFFYCKNKEEKDMKNNKNISKNDNEYKLPKRIIRNHNIHEFAGIYYMEDGIAVSKFLNINYKKDIYCMVINNKLNKASFHLLDFDNIITAEIIKIDDNRYKMSYNNSKRYFSMYKHVLPAFKNMPREEKLFIYFEDSTPLPKEGEDYEDPDGEFAYHQDIKKCLEMAEINNRVNEAGTKMDVIKDKDGVWKQVPKKEK